VALPDAGDKLRAVERGASEAAGMAMLKQQRFTSDVSSASWHRTPVWFPVTGSQRAKLAGTKHAQVTHLAQCPHS
jgi:hypothetical protein